MSFLTQPISFFPNSAKRSINGTIVNVVITEVTNDTISITKQPVQQGASIADHAYKEPTTLSMTVYYSPLDDTLSQIYAQYLELQVAFTPFTVVTPKRTYANMLLFSIGLTTDKNTENNLALNLQFQEVVIVSVATTNVPRQKQKAPAKTQGISPAGNKSALFSSKEGILGLFGK